MELFSILKVNFSYVANLNSGYGGVFYLAECYICFYRMKMVITVVPQCYAFVSNIDIDLIFFVRRLKKIKELLVYEDFNPSSLLTVTMVE